MTKIPALSPVGSSNIEAMGWDAGRLFIRFKGGSVYSYEGVPKETYEGSKEVDSVGSWFRQNVRGKYQHHLHDD